MSMLNVFTIKKLIQKITHDIIEVMNHFENGMARITMSKARLKTRDKYASKRLIIYRTK